MGGNRGNFDIEAGALAASPSLRDIPKAGPDFGPKVKKRAKRNFLLTF